MAKTITVRIDDNVYDLLKKAAEGQKRTISNFMEFAALNYIVSDSTVDEHEMAEILEHAEDPPGRFGRRPERPVRDPWLNTGSRKQNPFGGRSGNPPFAACTTRSQSMSIHYSEQPLVRAADQAPEG